ncbi:protein of unknown function [Ruminococcaceae bacterium BL-6]|nr:protein of unknown function [Ruminococcaceae bacterium BL-6]
MRQELDRNGEQLNLGFDGGEEQPEEREDQKNGHEDQNKIGKRFCQRFGAHAQSPSAYFFFR